MPNPRKLLFPFSVLYHGVTEVRNRLYDAGILNSQTYHLPVIAVGNLNMGGTGKSPMIEYLLKFLGENLKVATLSRGYKRKSKGFHLVELSDSVAQAGDEPLQFKNKYPETFVAVNANRREGITELYQFSPDVILLDDAFQHRKVKAGLYILLTSYGDLYTDDLILPAGNLRESSTGARRADIIVVTKCPEDLKEAEMEEIRKKLKPSVKQEVYFTSIKYSEKIYSRSKALNLKDQKSANFELVTGIANPMPLVNYLKKKNISLTHHKFPDHHNFSEKEIRELQAMPGILTTEKDYMRLKDEFSADKLYYLPIEVEFLNGTSDKFRNKLLNFIHKK
jgi:tetraacyldisaccharide 4'-kinase